MSRNRPNRASSLQDEIRKQFGSAGTTRYLRALPGFKVERRIPQRLRKLLTELERTEDERDGVFAGNRARH
jgi:hypothetical protein